MAYKVDSLVITGGMVKNAQDRIESKIQPLLDDGAKKGWRLHTFTSTDTTKGINIVIVWEIP